MTTLIATFTCNIPLTQNNIHLHKTTITNTKQYKNEREEAVRLRNSDMRFYGIGPSEKRIALQKSEGLSLRKKYSSELGWGREDIRSQGAQDNFMYYEKLKAEDKGVSSHGITEETSGLDSSEHLKRGSLVPESGCGEEMGADGYYSA